jgi:hypothetical protein
VSQTLPPCQVERPAAGFLKLRRGRWPAKRKCWGDWIGFYNSDVWLTSSGLWKLFKYVLQAWHNA